jgi:hypothetical protein
LDRGERREGRRGAELGRGAAHAGERGGEEKGPRVRKRGFGLLGCRAAVLFSSSSSFLFLFYTQTFKQNYLNSIKFEFKSYKLNTRRKMLQHECTNMLTL